MWIAPGMSIMHFHNENVGHLWSNLSRSNHEIIAHVYVPGKVLGMYKVWSESVQGHSRYRLGQTRRQTDRQTDNKNIACTYVCYDVLSIYEVRSEVLQACSRYTSRHAFSQSKWPSVSHLWSNHEIIAHAYVPGKLLGMYKVWRKSVQGRPRYRFGQIYTQTNGRMDRRITKILHVHMYTMMIYPFMKFEVNCSRHVRDIAPDMHFHNKNGRQSAIFDQIMKLLLVHMSSVRY